MHRLIMTTLALCAVILFSSLAIAAMETPTELTLGPPEGMKSIKTMVTFPHNKHEAAKIECTQCHHTWDGESDIMKCSSSGCHDQPGKRGETAYYTAFHYKKADNSCLGCHKIVKKRDGKAVPLSCKDCHPKE